ncbi:MAG: phosphotransferase, partial [Okeania sp. SIO2D1]|nr:phosphotransferase [Okeania sp. SIO2D1]
PAQSQGNRLTASEQAERLSNIAKQALSVYGLTQASLKLISHGENTVFAVDTPNISTVEQERYSSSRFILRVHRANYLTLEAIESELRWLQFLSQKAQLPVPEPIATLEGKLCKFIKAQEVPEPRVCSLTRCLNGNSILDEQTTDTSPSLKLESIGRLLGQLHYHAEHWSKPESFTRPSWDWNGLFGDMAGYSNNGARVWELTPQPYRNLLESVSKQFQATVASLTEDPSQFGLIHGDFWAGNLLIRQQEIGVIDFADCGFGYWIYDLARFLNDFIWEPNFYLCLEKLLHGYNQIRPFPEAQLPHLKTFIAAQYATYALWQVNRAQDHPSFRDRLEQELEDTAVGIEQLQF